MHIYSSMFTCTHCFTSVGTRCINPEEVSVGWMLGALSNRNQSQLVSQMHIR